MSELRTSIEAAAAAVRSRLGLSPRVGIILGTGIEGAQTIAYKDIPPFPVATVESHAGQLVGGLLSGKPVVAMEGRFHCYEGYSLAQVTFPVRVMKALGASALIVTNACGGLNHRHERGDILVIEDHINLMGANPLVGPNDEKLGPRFPDMCAPYDPEFVRLAEAAALRHGFRTCRGVYAAMTGPCLETRAEYRMLRTIGADAIGMSTVPEVIALRHMGVRTAAMSCITNFAAGISATPLDHREVEEVANRTRNDFVRILRRWVSLTAKELRA